ncbi:hypothetical protein AgCh_001034 [Apium graveolens]
MGSNEQVDEQDVVIRNKVRLVAIGYSQQKCIGYDEIFVIVVTLISIRIFIAFVAQSSFKSFRSDYILGQDGFGTVYKGNIDENLRVGLKYLLVAVKVKVNLLPVCLLEYIGASMQFVLFLVAHDSRTYTKLIFIKTSEHQSKWKRRHTASTAAGNHRIPVIVDGHHFGNASGMAPRS